MSLHIILFILNAYYILYAHTHYNYQQSPCNHQLICIKCKLYKNLASIFCASFISQVLLARDLQDFCKTDLQDFCKKYARLAGNLQEKGHF